MSFKRENSQRKPHPEPQSQDVIDQILADKKELGSKTPNVTRNTIYVLRELITLILTGILITTIPIRDCNEMKRDVDLRGSTELGEYFNYQEKKSRFVGDGFTELNKIILYGIFGSYKDPETEGFDHMPTGWIQQLVPNIDSVAFVSSALTLSTESHDTRVRGRADIHDYRDRRSSATILPLTGEVQYFTKFVSWIKNEASWSEQIPIKDTNRFYRSSKQLKTTQQGPSQSYDYNEVTGGTLIYFDVFGTGFFSSLTVLFETFWGQINIHMRQTSYTKIFWNPNMRLLMYYQTSVSLTPGGLWDITNVADCTKPFREHESFQQRYYHWFLIGIVAIDFIWFSAVLLACPILAMREFWSGVKKSTDGKGSGPNDLADGRSIRKPSWSRSSESRFGTPLVKPRPEPKDANPWGDLQPMQELSPRFEDDGDNSEDYEQELRLRNQSQHSNADRNYVRSFAL